MTDHDVLWRSFANVERAGVEMDALMIALRDLLADGGLGQLRIDVDSFDGANHETEQGWSFGYSLYSYRVVPARGRATNRGWVSFGVSFWRPEDDRGAGWDGARTAKLYVAWWPPKGDGWNTDSLVVDGSGQSVDAVVHDRWCWRGVGVRSMSEAWFFCVRLMALRSRADLEREIAVPLRLLLEGRPAERVFAGCTALLLPPSLSGVAS